MTVEQVKVALKAAVAEFLAEVEKAMDQGDSFDLAVTTACKARPDLIEKEISLRDHLKMLQSAAAELASLSMRDLQAWIERRRDGAISCAVVSGLAGAAKRIPIAQLGVRYKGSQRIDITRAMMGQIVANFRKRDNGQIPVDYEHASEETEVAKGGPVPAAGWLKGIDDQPDASGILWGDVEWTPRAAAMIAAKEYLHISPFLDPTVRDSTTGQPQGWTLTSVALTNRPMLQGLPALVLSEAGGVGERREAGQVNGNDWAGIQLEVCGRVKGLMAAEHLEYSAALQRLMLSDRELWRRYEEARRRYLGHPGAGSRVIQDDSASSEISDLVKAKVAASEGRRMGHGVALNLVLSERPDLAARYKRELR